jgi:uncharacterized protein (DUF302 family)
LSYYFSKVVHLPFEDSLERVTEELMEEGFGILSDIDVKKTLKTKLDVDFRQYRILGACNPPFAYRALQAEDRIGLMLPCNVIVQERGEGMVEVSVVDPLASMETLDNTDLENVAREVRDRLKRVVEEL